MSNDYREYFVSRTQVAFANPIISQWHKRLLAIASRHIPNIQHKTILEIGAGHGFFAAHCKKRNLSYYGHEMNTAQAAILQQSGYAVTPATVPPIPAGEPVQLIWLSHILEHMPTFLAAKDMLQACYDRLDPQGYIVIVAPDILACKQYFWAADWSHGFPTSRTRVEQLLHETGFRIHRSMHHTCAITNPFFASLISAVLSLIPVDPVDYICKCITGNLLFSRFMMLCGSRQIFIIGKK